MYRIFTYSDLVCLGGTINYLNNILSNVLFADSFGYEGSYIVALQKKYKITRSDNNPVYSINLGFAS